MVLFFFGQAGAGGGGERFAPRVSVWSLSRLMFFGLLFRAVYLNQVCCSAITLQDNFDLARRALSWFGMVAMVLVWELGVGTSRFRLFGFEIANAPSGSHTFLSLSVSFIT